MADDREDEPAPSGAIFASSSSGSRFAIGVFCHR